MIFIPVELILLFCIRSLRSAILYLAKEKPLELKWNRPSLSRLQSKLNALSIRNSFLVQLAEHGKSPASLMKGKKPHRRSSSNGHSNKNTRAFLLDKKRDFHARSRQAQKRRRYGPVWKSYDLRIGIVGIPGLEWTSRVGDVRSEPCWAKSSSWSSSWTKSLSGRSQTRSRDLSHSRRYSYFYICLGRKN
jgi:hypothetical protein